MINLQKLSLFSSHRLMISAHKTFSGNSVKSSQLCSWKEASHLTTGGRWVWWLDPKKNVDTCCCMQSCIDCSFKTNGEHGVTHLLHMLPLYGMHSLALHSPSDRRLRMEIPGVSKQHSWQHSPVYRRHGHFKARRIWEDPGVIMLSSISYSQ